MIQSHGIQDGNISFLLISVIPLLSDKVREGRAFISFFRSMSMERPRDNLNLERSAPYLLYAIRAESGYGAEHATATCCALFLRFAELRRRRLVLALETGIRA